MALTAVNASVISHPPVIIENTSSTCNIGDVLSDRVIIHGTTTITSFGSKTNALRYVTFSGIMQITHHATSLILIGGASLTTAANDSAVFASDGLGNWRCLQYTTGTPPATTIDGITGLQDALDGKLDAADYTAADILTKIKTVDGTGSGLDADLLDGNSASVFVKTVNGTSPDGSGAVTISVAGGTQDVRLGATVAATETGAGPVTISVPSGHIITAVTMDTGLVLSGVARPVQKYVSGSWITVSQV